MDPGEVGTSRRRLLALCSGCLAAGGVGGYALGAEPFSDDCDPIPVTASRTSWPFPGYDAGHTRAPPDESAPDGPLAERWREEWHVDGVGQPIVANGDVIAPIVSGTAPSRIHVYDHLTGEKRWQNENSSAADRFDVVAIGERVYTHTDTEDETGVPAALAAGDGRRLWTWADGSSTRSFPALLVQAGLVHVGGSTAHALDARTGEQCWERTLGESFRRTPSCGDEIVVYTGLLERSLVALSATDGAERWRMDVTPHLHPEHDDPDSRINDYLPETPIVGGGRVFVPTFGGRLVALDESSGDVEWTTTSSRTEIVSRRAPASFELGALTDDVLLTVESDGLEDADALCAFDPDTGAERWRVEPDAEDRFRFSRPSIVGDTAYVTVYDGARGHARLLLFDLETGDRIDAHDLEGYGPSSPTIADGAVLAATSGGLFAFDSA